jgi:isopenicillin N synthase-like dioxygenase
MVSLPPISLPIIDISPYLSEKPSDLAKRSLVSAALHKACVQYGFFYLDISSYLDPHEPEELAALAKAFFSLPEEEKDRIALRHGDHARGRDWQARLRHH